MKPTAGHVLQKMRELFAKEMERLSVNTIVPSDTGVVAFGRYHIDPYQDLYAVHKHNGSVKTFAAQSHALAWCIADKFSQAATGRKIECLSERYHKLTQDLITFKYKYKQSTDAENKWVLEAKISNCNYALNNVRIQLEKCLSQAKYWQQQEFHHEIERSQTTNALTASSSSHGELSRAWSRIQ